MVGIGEIYGKILNIYLRPTAGGLMLVERSMIAAVGTWQEFDRVERVVHLEPMIAAGISALRHGLESHLRQYLPLGYDEYVLHGEECEKLHLEIVGDERQRLMLEVMIDAMREMHEVWRKDYSNRLDGLSETQSIVAGKFNRILMPFSELGWDNARRYYLMLLELLKGCDCNVLPSDAMVRVGYEKLVK